MIKFLRAKITIKSKENVMFDTKKLKTFSWVNVGNPDHEDFERLLTEYKIDEDTISDILDPDEQPRLELEDDYKVIIVRFPIANREIDTTWHTEPLSIIYSNKHVITVCRKRCDMLDKIKDDEMKTRESLILNIIWYIAESYLRALKELNKKVINSKKALSENIRKQELMQLLEVENAYTLYMASLKGNIAVMDKIDKLRGFTKDEDDQELAEDSRIEFNQAIEVVTSYSKMLKSIKETFESVINIDSNTYINRLTIWNIVLMVPSVVVGYYGMNMELPYVEHTHLSLVIFISIMVLLTGYGLYTIARRRVF